MIQTILPADVQTTPPQAIHVDQLIAVTQNLADMAEAFTLALLTHGPESIQARNSKHLLHIASERARDAIHEVREGGA